MDILQNAIDNYERLDDYVLDQAAIIPIIIHAFDIGNPMLTFECFMEQSELLMQEFHSQTILEQ